MSNFISKPNKKESTTSPEFALMLNSFNLKKTNSNLAVEFVPSNIPSSQTNFCKQQNYGIAWVGVVNLLGISLYREKLVANF